MASSSAAMMAQPQVNSSFFLGEDRCWTALRIPMAGGFSGAGDADAGVAGGRLVVFSLAAAPCR
jgi:hypothetical protein